MHMVAHPDLAEPLEVGAVCASKMTDDPSLVSFYERKPSSSRVTLIIPGLPLRPATKFFLRFGAPEGTWNVSLFKAACDMAESGFSLEAIEAKVSNVAKINDADRKIILMAYEYVMKHGVKYETT